MKLRLLLKLNPAIYLLIWNLVLEELQSGLLHVSFQLIQAALHS